MPNLTLKILKTGRHKIGGLLAGPPPSSSPYKLMRTDTDLSTESLLSPPSSVDVEHITYNAVALDLDGTLLRKNKTISDKTVSYLQGLHARGITIIIATGRAAPSVYATVIRLDLPEPIPVVCSNGSYGILCMPDPTQECGVRIVKELFSYPVPKSVVTKTLNLSNKLGCVMQYYLGNDIYANPTLDKHFELTELYSRLTGVETMYVFDNYRSLLHQRGAASNNDDSSSVLSSDVVETIFTEDHKSPSLVVQRKGDSSLFPTSSSASSSKMTTTKNLPSKLLVLCPKDEMEHVWKTFVNEFPSNEATLVYGAQGWFLEILYPQVCKGFGLERMCQQLEVDLDNVVAFGDADNDVEFIQAAGKGIVMKNGRNVVKKVADEITEYTNNEDGVRKALQQMEKDGLLHFVEFYS